jgi:hypothetical protein
MKSRIVAIVLALAAAVTAGSLVGQSPPTELLLVVNGAAPNPYGGYLAQILKAEGISGFNTVDISTLDAGRLSESRLVLLAETPLTAAQAGLLTSYVSAGGRLIAMRPDSQLAGSLGLTPLGGGTTGGYLSIATSSTIGAGFPGLTLPYHGTADHFSPMPGTDVVATLYTDRTTATAHPAVVRSGKTAAWTYDLARSVVFTRQGNPANAGVDRDGVAPIRTTDVFYGAIDLERVSVPHADHQMRLLSRVISELLADELPFPRLWYFPAAARTLMVLTGDAHSHSQSAYQQIIASTEARSARISLYLARYVPFPTPTELHDWRMQGHDFGVHPYGSADSRTLEEGLSAAVSWFIGQGYHSPGRTSRNHLVEWEGWVGGASTAAAYGIGMDLTYFAWGPTVTHVDGRQSHGFINGSGLPMLFVDEAGAVIPVYQQATSLIDEQLLVGSYSENLTAAQALAVSRQLIDESLSGGYSALATQFHVDFFDFPEVREWAEGTMDYARSNGVPMWTAERWLRYTEARAATAISNLSWSTTNRELMFTVSVPHDSERQWVMLPTVHDGRSLTSLLVDDSPLTPVQNTITGRPMSFLSIGPGAHTVLATYAAAANVAPVAVNDSASTDRNAAVTLSVLANDTDANGDTLSIMGTTPPVEGTVLVQGAATILYTPVAGACGPDSFTYTISDGRGGQSTATVSVNVVCTDGAETHATALAFSSCSMFSGTMLTMLGDGEVRLAGTLGDEYGASVLDPAVWTAGTWNGGSYTPQPGNGVLSLAGSSGVFVRSTAAVHVTALEAVARFTAAPWQHVGWATRDFADNQYLIFSTAAGTDTLFARSNDGSGEQTTELGPIPVGFHTYRIERATTTGGHIIRYFVDGAQRAQHIVSVLPLMHVYQSHNSGAAPALDIDRLWVFPSHVVAGTFTGCPMDAGRPITWTTASWFATVPSGATLSLRTRTSADGAVWTAWSAPLTTSGQHVGSPSGRYLQYLLELTSSNGSNSPTLDSVTIAYSETGTANMPPVAVDDEISVRAGRVAAIQVLANDSDPNADPLTVSSVTQAGKGAVSAAAGVVTYLPFAGACGPDSLGYTVSDGRGGFTTAVVSVNVLCATGAEVDTTTLDFGACTTRVNTIVTRVGNGEIRLAGVVGDEYDATELDLEKWVAGTWAGGEYLPTFESGTISVAHQDGAFVRSVNVLSVSRLETSARFTSTPWQHVGWADLDFAGGRYLLFSTFSGSNTLYARSNDGSGEQQTSLGPLPPAFRTYRIDRVPQSPTTDLVKYVIDGALVAEHTVGTVPPLHVYASHNGGASPALAMDRLWVYPDHVTSGSFESCPIDAGREIIWSDASWVVQPVTASVGLQTRTSPDAVTWTDWSQTSFTSGDAIASPPGRFLQYRLGLATASVTESPVVESVSIGFDEPNYVPVSHDDIAATGEQTPVSIAVLANDTDLNEDALVVAAVVGAGHGTANVDATGTRVVYVPAAGFCGSDTFSYTASDGRGGTASAGVVVSVGCGGLKIHSAEDAFAGACSVKFGTMVTRHGDGEVRLAGTFGDEYENASVDDGRWTAGTWAGGSFVPSVASGALSIAGGVYVRSNSVMPVSTFEASVRFTGAPWEHVGWGGLDFADSRYLIFSTFNGSSNLYARSNNAGSEERTDLGPIPDGFHTYRIEKSAGDAGIDVVSYFVDGILRAQHTLATMPALHVYQSHGSGASPALDVDRLWVYPPHLGSGTFESCPMDAGAAVVWMSATWNAAVPLGSTVALRTRTSHDGSAWTAWSALVTVSGQAITSPPGRFLQYLLELTSSSSADTPVVESVGFVYPASASDLIAPAISSIRVNEAPTSVTIGWSTDEPATGAVEYGLSTAYGSIAVLDGAVRTEHSVTIDGLTENTEYHFRVTARDAAGNHTVSSDISVTTPTQSAVTGEWGPLVNWPLVAVHAALLHTGEVLLWDAWELPDTPSGRLWDPATETFTNVPVPGSALFCAGHSMLPDGRLLVIGGHHGAAVGIHDTNIFDPVSRTWSRVSNMNIARWYPTAITLHDGRVLSLGGQIQPGLFIDRHEVYDPATDTWTILPGAQRDIGEYPRTFLAPDGRVFMAAGPDQQSRLLNVASESWTAVGQAPVPFGSVAAYRPGKIIATGGSLAMRGTAVIDLNQPSPAWVSTAQMSYPRFQHNLITLPDGKVLAVGGSSEANLVSKKGVLPLELWDPVQESWTTLASMADPRMYHSIALLLPDGRILTAGGGRAAPANDYPTAQIFSPPYLFKGARPSISSAPPSADYGSTFVVETPDAASVSSVALVRLASVTHGLDMDQRYIPLNYASTGSSLLVQAPANAFNAPPGYYQMFIVSSRGVPSVASMIRLGN